MIRRAGLVVGVLFLSACQAAARPSASPPTTGGAITTATAAPDPCPGRSGRSETAETIDVGSQARTFRLTLPTDRGPRPLILLFHGSGSDAAEISTVTQLPARAAARGYAVAAPDAINHNWQLSLPTTQTPDLSMVGALIAAVSRRLCIDPHRIYSAGFSLGSEFAAIVACAPELPVVAAAMASAELLVKPCARTVPVIAFHGTADPFVPYRDGAIGLSLPGIRLRGVEKSLGDWAALDGCGSVPAVAAISYTEVRRTWPGCPAGTRVVLYTTLGGSHVWPGEPLDATGRIIDFFDSLAQGAASVTPVDPQR